MDHCHDYCLIVSLTTSHANKYYNISEGTLQLVTVTSSYSPFAEPCAKEAPSVRSQGLLSSLPLPTAFYRSFVRKLRAGAQSDRFPSFLLQFFFS